MVSFCNQYLFIYYDDNFKEKGYQFFLIEKEQKSCFGGLLECCIVLHFPLFCHPPDVVHFLKIQFGNFLFIKNQMVIYLFLQMQ